MNAETEGDHFCHMELDVGCIQQTEMEGILDSFVLTNW